MIYDYSNKHYWGYSEGRGKAIHITPLRGGEGDDMDYPVLSYCGISIYSPQPMPFFDYLDPEGIHGKRDFHGCCKKCKARYDQHNPVQETP